MPAELESTEMTHQPICLICRGTRMWPSFYPPNRFNGKLFSYYGCKDCGSLSIAPIPDPTDFDLMYGSQGPGFSSESEPIETDFPRFHYHKFQWEDLKWDAHLAPGRSLLDYGCGNGSFLTYAKTLGFDPIGIEYSPSNVRDLRESKGLDVHSVVDLGRTFDGHQFDVIHFGHVLEHLTDPGRVILDLTRFAHDRTLFLFDGPLENNPCVTRFLIDLGSRLKKKTSNSYCPQHLTFTNHRSQRQFFEALGFRTLRFRVVEHHWPLPSALDRGSIKVSALFLFARMSAHVSGLVPHWGNLFHYAGVLNRPISSSPASGGRQARPR